MTNQDNLTPFEIAAAELRERGVSLVRLPVGKYAICFRGSSERGTRIVETLDEAVALALAMTHVEADASGTDAGPRRRGRPRLTEKAPNWRLRMHLRLTHIRALKKQHKDG